MPRASQPECQEGGNRRHFSNVHIDSDSRRGHLSLYEPTVSTKRAPENMKGTNFRPNRSKRDFRTYGLLVGVNRLGFPLDKTSDVSSPCGGLNVWRIGRSHPISVLSPQPILLNMSHVCIERRLLVLGLEVSMGWIVWSACQISTAIQCQVIWQRRKNYRKLQQNYSVLQGFYGGLSSPKAPFSGGFITTDRQEHGHVIKATIVATKNAREMG
ncbi:hypothetical protein R3P38DRAFT_2814110 [Favolaschia claudopus]|uniref:Uncharacterized protein n=1 Tax=Favolaschia claudopus TaxID=2862362 RepID=A0AAV9Z3T4_9AGAR